MGTSFVKVCSESTEIPHFAVFLGSLSFFHINRIDTIYVLLLLLDRFKISVVQIQCIPCVLGIPFVDFSYRKAYEMCSRNLFLHIACIFLYVNIHKCIYT